MTVAFEKLNILFIFIIISLLEVISETAGSIETVHSLADRSKAYATFYFNIQLTKLSS